MSDSPARAKGLEGLRLKGDAAETLQWHNGEPDYVEAFGLDGKHVPDLIKLASEWPDVENRPDDESRCGPIHAWRALAQLRAPEAVEPLLDMMNQLNEQDDDWYSEEFHHVFGLIGAAAIPAVAAYMADSENREFPRIEAACGLREIAKHYPETRDQIVALLEGQLAKQEPERYAFNGFLVGNLVDLKAVESAEVIERAFAADVLEKFLTGDWGDVRRQLGVQGLGLVPDRPDRPRRNLGPRTFLDVPAPSDQATRTRQRRTEQKAKAKKKQQKKARKRNR